MKTTYLIPLLGSAQTFSITLAGVQYNCQIVWNSASQCWVLDISDSSDSPVVQGIAVVTGADLLGQYGYLGFGGQLTASTNFDPLAVPDFYNLGANGNLYFTVTD